MRLNRLLITSVIAGAIASLPVAVLAQQPAEPAPVMKKLAAMVGEWRGTSSIMAPQGRTEAHSWEYVESKLGGLVLIVHGRHTDAKDTARVMHEAVAMVFHDAATQQLRVVPVRMDGGTVETYAKETEQGLEWGFALPNGAGRIRYRVDLSQPGVWKEVGEFSRDGETWLPTLSIDLKKVQ